MVDILINERKLILDLGICLELVFALASINLDGALFIFVLRLVLDDYREDKVVFEEQVEARLLKELFDFRKSCGQSLLFTAVSFGIVLSQVIDVPWEGAGAILVAIVLTLLVIACRHVQHSYDVGADLELRDNIEF